MLGNKQCPNGPNITDAWQGSAAQVSLKAVEKVRLQLLRVSDPELMAAHARIARIL